MQTAQVLVASVALVISIASFVVARIADRRSKKAEEVRNLLGEKESVAFGALKLLRDGLPKDPLDRRLIIAALMQACVFEASDRARALLYRVIENNRPESELEFTDALRMVDETFNSMDRYRFTKEELDLSRGRRRIETVRKILHGDPTPYSVTPAEASVEHAAKRNEDTAGQFPRADATKASSDVSELEKVQKDLLWGTYLELRTHARHAETVRASAINYVVLVTAALITVISLDNKITRDDWPLCLTILFLGLFATIFAAAYIERYSRNRERAHGVRKYVDERFLSGRVAELCSEADEKSRSKSRVLNWAKKVAISTHVFWLGLPAIILITGSILTFIALKGG